jgi:hypothetical protein
MRRKQLALTLEILDGIADGSLGITCPVTTDLWGINFDWQGEQSAFDAVEARCNALGFTFAGIQEEMEQEAVRRYSEQLKAGRPKESPEARMDREHRERQAKIAELRADQERIKAELADLADMQKRLEGGRNDG